MLQPLFDLAGGYASPIPDESMHLFSDPSDIGNNNYPTRAYDLGIVEFTNYDDQPHAPFFSKESTPSIRSDRSSEFDLSAECDFSDLSDLSDLSDEGDECCESDPGKDLPLYPTSTNEYALDAEQAPKLEPSANSSVIQRAPQSFKEILRACRKDTFRTMQAENANELGFVTKPTIHIDNIEDADSVTRWPMFRMECEANRNLVPIMSPRVRRFRQIVALLPDYLVEPKNEQKHEQKDEMEQSAAIHEEANKCSELVVTRPVLGRLDFLRRNWIVRAWNAAKLIGLMDLSFSKSYSRLASMNSRVYNQSNGLVFPLMRSLGFRLDHSRAPLS